MKNKIKLLLAVFLMTGPLMAQKIQKQELGINLAGLLIKNQATIAPSFLYRYTINRFQTRLQIAYDSRITDENRDGLFKQQQSTFLSQRDTAFVYDPAKNNTIGGTVGAQFNKEINNSKFKYFYGFDLIYMYKEFKRNGSGVSKLVSGSSTQTTQTTQLKTVSQNQTQTMGLGIPMGISYFWDHKFFISVEAKFVMVYQIGSSHTATESIQQTSSTQSTTLIFDTKTNTHGFDVSLKPISGLCFGIVF